MKILISSSNHTRYQVNANIPVDDDGFYLRTPMDGRSFTYQGQTFPRKAVQRVAFSPQYPTNISLPIFQPGWTNVDFTEVELKQNQLLIFLIPQMNMSQL